MEKLTLIAFYQKALLVFAFVIANNVKTQNCFLHTESSRSNSSPQFSNLLCSNWTGNINTDWNNAGNWCGASIPSFADNVVIPTGVPNYPVISAGVNASVNSITINSSASLTLTGSGNLTLSNNGAFTNNGTFTATGSSGAVIFSGSGTVSGSVNFNNVTINGSVNFGLTGVSTISGNLTLNNGGTASGASTHLVTYTGTSTLIYNETTTTANEWSAGASGTTAAGAGIPQNVIIQSGTVSINSGGTNRAIVGNLNINPGAVLQISGSQDLFISGNWSNSGTFVANGRKVTFRASGGIQVASGNTTFFDLTLDNSGAITDFGSCIITVNDEFRISHGTMNGNTSTFIFNGSTSTLEGAGAKNFYNFQINAGTNLADLTASSGNTVIGNSYVNDGSFIQHNTHTIRFNKSGATESLNGTGTSIFGNVTVGGPNLSFPTVLNANTHSFTVTGGSLNFTVGSTFNGNNNTVIFSNKDAVISGVGTANFYNLTTNVAVDPGNISNLNNNLLINAGGSIVNHSPAYSASSTLMYNTSNATYNTGFEWTGNTVLAGIGEPQNIIIQNTNNIVLTGARTLPGNLNISAGDALNINGNILTLNGTVYGTGTLTGSNTSGLIVNAPGNAGTVYFTPNNFTTGNTTNNYLQTFTVNSNAAVTLGDSLNICSGTAVTTFGKLKVDGTLYTQANSNAGTNLTLKSGKYGDAVVIQSTTGAIKDTVTVERFIPARRAWRFIGVPFSSSSQTIRDAWQEGVNNDDLIYANNKNPNPGYGTHITYTPDPALGYDPNTTVNPSLKTWVSATGSWSPGAPSTATTNLLDYGGAYCLFVRGSRAVNLSWAAGSPVDNTVLRMKGILNEPGTANNAVQMNGSVAADKYMFLSNPYASPVNLTGVFTNSGGVYAGQVWAWDPKLNGSYGVGGYVTFDKATSVWVPYTDQTETGSYSGINEPLIQSGQAFMLKAKVANPQVFFQQADKTSSENSVSFAPKAKPSPRMFINLMMKSADSLLLVDGVAAAFGKQFSAKTDEDDASKIWNFNENIALLRDTNYLAVEARPVPVLADTVFIYMGLYKNTPGYALKIFSDYFDPQVQVWLVDKITGTKTLVNINGTVYPFATTGSDTSYRHRFMLVFRRTFIATPVAVTRVANQANPDTTGDANSIASGKSNVSVHPNPIKTGEKVMLQFSNMNKGKYQVTVTSTAGKALAGRSIEHDGGSSTYAMQTDARWSAGSYFVRITGEDGFTLITKLVISK